MTLARALDPYTYTRLSPTDPRREALRSAYLASLVRHQLIRERLGALLLAWQAAGVEVLLFKGWHLAEFVYEVPGTRHHGDVDLHMPEGSVARARSVALANGWAEIRSGGFLWGAASHNPLTLVAPGIPLQLDVHSRLLQGIRGGARIRARITEAVREAADRRVWQGVEILTPAPADALLILALNRVWADGRRLKPHDAIDARLLGARTSPEALRRRAQTLGCAGSVADFLRLCDPWRASPEGASAPVGRTARGTLAILRERGWIRGERAARRIHTAARLGPRAAAALPELAWIARRLRREDDLQHLLTTLIPQRLGSGGLTVRGRYALVASIRRAASALAEPGVGVCVLRSIAVCRALRRRGVDARFVSGVRRDPSGKLEGHAWVEADGAVLPDLAEPWSRSTYRVNLEWPL